MSTALYRRYRPETFTDVIGQEHVTAPLMQALRSDRVNHAYLFSGPRGCGKTTSARILARVLNCARWVEDEHGQRPDRPCGECDSCRELARGGSGSLDVVEIDAASHGGVDDARELRERATFVPARDRYKVYVIDEAHMVTPQGFNALLKLVEEPPEHVKFVFATTEPDKVLPTIRSRTHHYPFHLVPPERLLSYLEDVCEKEDVPVGKGVLPLVVRAGAGSVRDALSVLDQLMAGADAGGIDYDRAISLLGYTHASLLDDVVEALAAADGASVFRVVDRVIGSGHDPRRFVEDLLERLRDLIIVQAVGEAARGVLRGVPEDQLSRMAGQAQHFGAGELSRAADTANSALTEMTGATSPRLHLELLCARLLLPGADATERGLTARMDRIERRLGVPDAPRHEPPAREQPARQPARQPVADEEPPSREHPPAVAPTRPAAEPAGAPTAPAADEKELDTVRRMWPDVLVRLAAIKRGTWTLVSQNARVAGYSDGVLRLAFDTDGLAKTFSERAHAELVRQALIDVLGIDAKIEPVVGIGQPPMAAPPEADRGPEPDATLAPEPATVTAPEPDEDPDDAPVGDPEPVLPAAEPTERHAGAEAARAAVRHHDRPGRRDDARAEAAPTRSRVVEPENDVPAMDDPDADDSGMVGPPVVEQLLGGRVIEVQD